MFSSSALISLKVLLSKVLYLISRGIIWVIITSIGLTVESLLATQLIVTLFWWTRTDFRPCRRYTYQCLGTSDSLFDPSRTITAFFCALALWCPRVCRFLGFCHWLLRRLIFLILWSSRKMSYVCLLWLLSADSVLATEVRYLYAVWWVVDWSYRAFHA
jgi:hypothetical protein